MGGFEILLKYLDHPHTSLQWRAGAVLGLCFQNNTYGQDQALKLNVLPRLVELVHSQTSDEQVNVKSMFALAGKYLKCPAVMCVRACMRVCYKST